MRLIDADKLIQKFKKKNQTLYTDEYEEGRNVGISWCTEDVVNAPTVEAIPFEWIEKYAKRCIALEDRNYFAYKGFSDIGEGILNMLVNWEKENE